MAEPTFRDVAFALSPYFNNNLDLLNATDSMVSFIASYTSTRTELTHEQLVSIAMDSNNITFELREGRKITAIKTLRNMTGCGLKAAKDAVEDQRVQMRIVDPWSTLPKDAFTEPPF